MVEVLELGALQRAFAEAVVEEQAQPEPVAELRLRAMIAAR